MQRVLMAERPGWRQQADSLGFRFHSLGGSPYLDESAYYRFTLRQIEDGIEAPTQEVHELCMDLVSRAVRSEEYLRRLALPERFWDLIRTSWTSGEPHLYGRMDFAYDGYTSAKLFELNYDTPTSLYEAAVFQWLWLQQCVQEGSLPAGADQFNSLHEKLLQAFSLLLPKVAHRMHFGAVEAKDD